MQLTAKNATALVNCNLFKGIVSLYQTLVYYAHRKPMIDTIIGFLFCLYVF